MLTTKTDIIRADKLYYDNMLTWYFRKYLKNYTYVRYLCVVVIFFVLAAFLIYQTSTLDRQVKRYPFPIYFEDEVNYFAKIKSVGQFSENLNFSLARYIITKYLQKSEEFHPTSIDPKSLESRLTFIKSLSSSKVFQEYFEFVDIDKNLNSPLLKYRYGNSRTINIDKIEFAIDVDVPYSAKVYYTISENVDSKTSVIHKNVKIQFFMSIVNKDFMNSGKQFSFLITDLIPESDDKID